MLLSSTEVTSGLCNTQIGSGEVVSEVGAEPCMLGRETQDKVDTGSFPHLPFSGQTRAVSLKTVGQVRSVMSLLYIIFCDYRTRRVDSSPLLTARRRPAQAVSPQY